MLIKICTLSSLVVNEVLHLLLLLANGLLLFPLSFLKSLA